MSTLNRIFRHIRWYYTHLWSDEKYVKDKFEHRLGYTLNLQNPKTFNEKLQWLKLYAHRSEYVTMADKFLVKEYVSRIIGEEYVVPYLGVWGNARDIDFDKLPNSFVLKCNHNSGGNVVCKDKSKLNIKKSVRFLNKCLKRGYFYQGRDKQYRDIQRKILAEVFLDDHREGELQDYKFWCFNGNPIYMYMTNKGTQIFENFYDMEFNPVAINHGFPRFKPEYAKPKEFELMRELAEKLSKGIPFVRVDFYDIDGHVYFGEYTFFDWGGFQPFSTYEQDLELGKLIKLNIHNDKMG